MTFYEEAPGAVPYNEPYNESDGGSPVYYDDPPRTSYDAPPPPRRAAAHATLSPVPQGDRPAERPAPGRAPGGRRTAPSRAAASAISASGGGDAEPLSKSKRKLARRTIRARGLDALEEDAKRRRS